MFNKTTFLISLLVISLVSCIYEDGPNVSLRTKKSRLVGLWNQEEPKLGDGVRSFIEFKSNGDLTTGGSYEAFGQTQNYSSDGSWEWGTNKDKVKIIYSGGVDSYTISVNRLTNKELWYKVEGDETIYKLGKN
ncbi:MAG: hypothetical protein VXX63_07915 [Bacteroidota bacterium]|nr:hypothetical protein [Bacteroidota bacterium]